MPTTIAPLAFVSAYAFNDAAGARLCSASGAYALWTFPLTALPTLVRLLRGERASMAPQRLLESLRWTDLQRGLGGGASGGLAAGLSAVA
ncbi:Drug/metabolite transporter (DMT) superfamily protein (fragment) [Thiomonas sp. X19]|uniref:hypothetical protein n=1 Tax=Thiomonas sp. X19 TaxID=1050370 RepID=UPI000B755590